MKIQTIRVSEPLPKLNCTTAHMGRKIEKEVREYGEAAKSEIRALSRN